LVFNANGGSGAMDTVSIKTDETIALPVNTFNKTGYTFIGWSNVQNGSVVYNDGQSFSMSSSTTITLYAVWSANTNTIYFNANGGSGDMTPQQAKTDEKITLKQNEFIHEGYVFKGWSNSANGTIMYADKAEYIVGTEPAVTFYAVWEIISIEEAKYTVKHFLQTTDGTGYELDDTKELYAMPESMVSPAVNNYTGFIAPTIQTKAVKADGTLVIKYYYNLESEDEIITGTADAPEGGISNEM
jgi:uncharacterized repeat protein (TIGR02543 family)